MGKQKFSEEMYKNQDTNEEYEKVVKNAEETNVKENKVNKMQELR